MRGAKMCIFDVLHAVRWHDEAQIGKRFSTATGKSSENQRLHSQSPPCLQSSNDIRRISAPRNCQRNIAFFGKTLQLLGDSFVETMVLEIRKSAMPSKPLPPVKRSSLGADAGVIGAATLVLHNAYAPSLQLLNLT